MVLRKQNKFIYLDPMKGIDILGTEISNVKNNKINLDLYEKDIS